MADSTRPTADTATADCSHDIKLTDRAGNAEGLVDNQLQGLQSEILVDGAPVDGDLTVSGVQTNAGDGLLATTGTVEVGFALVYMNLSFLSSDYRSYTWGFCASWLWVAPAYTFGRVNAFATDDGIGQHSP